MLLNLVRMEVDSRPRSRSDTSVNLKVRFRLLGLDV